MTPFQVYKLYLALRLHFTSDKYDIIEKRGAIRTSEQAFARRNDLMGVNRLARKYNVSQCTNFMVANFVGGEKNGGMFAIGSEAVYKQWQGKLERLGYMYQDELRTLCESVKAFDDLMDCSRGHPPILKAYLNGSVSIETLTILEKCLPWVDRVHIYLENDVIWPDLRRTIVKYKPFLKIRKDKYSAITQKILTNTFDAAE